jgi:crotonobetainyl-CoA:carnitine CoA-transferase CaiB-like acyl-CoA transferase
MAILAALVRRRRRARARLDVSVADGMLRLMALAVDDTGDGDERARHGLLTGGTCYDTYRRDGRG